MVVESNNDTAVRAVIIFAEGIFPGESHVTLVCFFYRCMDCSQLFRFKTTSTVCIDIQMTKKEDLVALLLFLCVHLLMQLLIYTSRCLLDTTTGSVPVSVNLIIIFCPYLNVDGTSSTQRVSFFYVYLPIEDVRRF